MLFLLLRPCGALPHNVITHVLAYTCATGELSQACCFDAVRRER